MKRVLMVSMAALLAGATMMPAAAQDVRARVVAGASAQAEAKGPMRSDRRDDRRGNRNVNRGNRNDGRHDRRDWRGDRGNNRHDPRPAPRHDNRHRPDNRRYVRHDDRRWRGNQWRPEYRYRAPTRYVYPTGYSHVRWRVGHRMPAPYYGRPYYVDYATYRLPPPPYGHRWVRSDRDVVLVAIATGLVLDVLYDLYY